MYILVNCGSPLYSVLLFPLKKMMDLIMIVAPILLIISFAIIFIKGVTNPEDKKLISKIKNAIIALICIFLVSCITNVTMKIVGSSTDISACWNNAKKVKTATKYYDIDGKDKKPPQSKEKYKDYKENK